ncbi:MAG: hypothetical protein ABW212_05300 [Pseudonocardia sediminis]
MAVTGPQDEPFPFSDDVPDWCWQTPPEMGVGRWIEIPIDDDGSPRWMRVEVLMSPLQTLEYRWAVRAGRDGEHYWMKIAPWLRFRSCGQDPTGSDGSPAR